MRGWEIKMILIKKFHLFQNALKQKGKSFLMKLRQHPTFILTSFQLQYVENGKVFRYECNVNYQLNRSGNSNNLINKKI